MVSKEHAGFGVRFVAQIIDAIILGFAGGMVGGLMGMTFYRVPTQGHVGSIIGAHYVILLWVNWNGQTIGKKVMKIKVVREDGKPLDYGTAIIRWLCYILSAIPLGLGYFWVIWDDKKQAWHDKLAKTYVVKE